GLMVNDADLNIGYGAQCVLQQHVAQGEHVGAEAKLKVDGCSQSLLVTKIEDPPGIFQILAHRLLNERSCAVWKLLQHPKNLVAGNSDVENRVRQCGGFVDARENGCDAEGCGGIQRSAWIDVVKSGYPVPEFSISRNVCRPNNSSGADNDDRER